MNMKYEMTQDVYDTNDTKIEAIRMSIKTTIIVAHSAGVCYGDALLGHLKTRQKK